MFVSSGWFAYIGSSYPGIDSLLNILIVTPEPISGASSRLRAIDFMHYWREGRLVAHLSFLSERSFRLKDRPGNLLGKLLSVAVDWLWFLVRYPFYLAKSDVVFVHRNIAPLGPPLLEQVALWFGKRLVYDFDDAIYLNPETAVNQWLAPLKMNAYRTAKLCQIADHVIVGNAHLAGFAEKHNTLVSIVPTSVDLQAYRKTSLPPKNQDQLSAEENIVIGWIGGPGTIGFVEAIWPALQRLLDANESVRLLLVGGNIKADHPGVISEPWQLSTENQLLATMDIGINPLLDNEFTRGKCGFKNIQYMASGVVCVTSPVGVCRDQVEEGVTGRFASSQEDWFQVLTSLIANPDQCLLLADQAASRLQQYDRTVTAEKLLAILQNQSKLV